MSFLVSGRVSITLLTETGNDLPGLTVIQPDEFQLVDALVVCDLHGFNRIWVRCEPDQVADYESMIQALLA